MKICESMLERYFNITNGPLSIIIPESKLEELLEDCDKVVKKCRYSVNNVCPNYLCYQMANKYNIKNYEGEK